MSNQTEEESNTMKPIVKRKWVRALRSGKFRRTTGQFKNYGRYCCLGVLCEVTKEPYKGHQATLDGAFRSRIGMTSEIEAALISLNDGEWDSMDTSRFGKPPKGYRGGHGAAFKVIADWIRDHA